MQLCPLCSTSVPTTAQFCPSCGASLALPSGGTLLGVLPKGTQLKGGSYSLGKVLGRGGFGITYLGADSRLKRPTALKEFFPAGAVRHGTTVVPPSSLAAHDYKVATQRFLQEAQVLARFRHTSIVAVHDVFEENGTAYMVMEYLAGETLAEQLERRRSPFTEAEVVELARPLVDALQIIHAANVLHRDIKPDNTIVVNGSGPQRPVLIDFGAARDFVRGTTIRQSVVLTPGYAPLEQYGEQARRGPFTDIYAFAATLYHLATGIPPVAAIDRAVGIELRRPHELNPRLSLAFSRALMHGLEMQVDRRPQTAGEFLQELLTPPIVPGYATPTPAVKAPSAKPASARAPSTSGRSRMAPQQQSIGPHRMRLKQIAKELQNIGAVSTVGIRCPVCRDATMIEPAAATGTIRCPVCRAGGLQDRVPAAQRPRCVLCHSGSLVKSKLDGLIFCPACKLGVVKVFTKRRYALVFREHGAKCDRCQATFEYARWTDALTLTHLPQGPGQMSFEHQRQCKSRQDWARMAQRGEEVYRCDHCQAEWDKRGKDSYELIAVGGRLDGVPPEHRGVARSEIEWLKFGYGVDADQGTHYCLHCNAQFNGSTGDELTLLSSPRDPFKIVARYGGKALPVKMWRALAAGMRDPAATGFVCPACSAELTGSGKYNGPQTSYQLAAYDRARDPYGVGARYANQSLRRYNWQRVAAGVPTDEEEAELQEEAARVFWNGLLAEEFGDPEADHVYPAARSSGELALLQLGAQQFKQTKEGWVQHDTGTMWLTTKKLVFQGARANATVPFDKIIDLRVEYRGQRSLDIVAIHRIDRTRPVFFETTMKSTINIEGLSVELTWDTWRFIELVNRLRG